MSVMRRILIVRKVKNEYILLTISTVRYIHACSCSQIADLKSRGISEVFKECGIPKLFTHGASGSTYTYRNISSASDAKLWLRSSTVEITLCHLAASSLPPFTEAQVPFRRARRRRNIPGKNISRRA